MHALYKKILHDSSPELKFKFTKYRNNLTSIIHSAEKYDSDKFDSSYCNIRKTWENIKTIINDPGLNKKIKEIKMNGNADKITNDRAIIANKFNSFFANVGPNLAQKILSAIGDDIEYLTGQYPNSMLIVGTNEMK